jgi:transposase
MTKRYTKEFKLDAVKLANKGDVSVAQVARDLGVTSAMLYKWRNEATSNAEAFPGKGKLGPQDEEVRRLRREVERLRMERDILKKATAFFVKENQRG